MMTVLLWTLSMEAKTVSAFDEEELDVFDLVEEVNQVQKRRI